MNDQPEITPVQEVQSQEPPMLPLLPLKNVVLLPKSIIPIIVGRASSIEAVEQALRHDKAVFITAQKVQDIESPGPEDVFEYGTRSTILQVMRMPNNALKILVEGVCRARAVQIVANGFLSAIVEDLPTADAQHTKELEALWRHVKSLYQQYAQLNEKAPQELLGKSRVEDIDYLADTIAVHLNLSFDERQKILEEISLHKRLFMLAQYLQKEIGILETEQRIRGRVQKQVEKNQREYYLTEQIKAIQKELGREDQLAEINELRERAKKVGLSAEAAERVERELNKLEQMPPMSAEAVVSRNYIDWLLAIPWKKASKDSLSLEQAEKLLNKSHAGLEKPKERILEFVAASKFSGSMEKTPIICFVGPAGVGKSSLALAIAKSLGREFVRISLGGVKDEAEIRGHRRTYIGALPGKIVQAMRKTKTINPVILLDEIDKLSRDFSGDPASALLEVLDPEQNKAFIDHFLEVEYDLSKVMFITTANMLDGISYPLLDRMELIQLSGYTAEEKVAISTNFLIPKKLKEYHLKNSQFKLPDSVIELIISDYTKEAGVRQLERLIAKAMRKTIQVLLTDKKKTLTIVTPELIREWFGHAKFRRTSLEQGEKAVGLARGLAWTEVGGDILEIETTVFPGKGSLALTGQLGEVMQESAQAAMSYIKSRASHWGLKSAFFSTHDTHVHVPEGATPKDGPSAGIAMACSLISAFTDTPIKPHLSMSGEITLRGRVLAVGGLKEKLLAAKAYGMKTVILPKDSEEDVREALKGIDHGLDLIFVNHMDEVVQNAFVRKPLHVPLQKKNSQVTLDNIRKKAKKL